MAQQDLGNPYMGKPATITSGDPMSRADNQYGKDHSYLAPAMGPALGPGTDPGASVRDAMGGMKRHPRVGGLADPNDYSKQNAVPI